LEQHYFYIATAFLFSKTKIGKIIGIILLITAMFIGDLYG